MECRKLEITLVSAKSLPDVRALGRMKVYAKVSITGESGTRKKTPADREGDTNPIWNFTIDYMITESAIHQSDVKVAIRLFCKRTLGDRFVGEVNIPIKSLFEKGHKADRVMSYQVCGTSKGRLNILYSFGETVMVRKPSGFRWTNAIELGFLVLLGGLLGDDGDGNDARAISRDVHVVEDDDDDDGDDEVPAISKDVRVVEDDDNDDDGDEDGFYDC